MESYISMIMWLYCLITGQKTYLLYKEEGKAANNVYLTLSFDWLQENQRMHSFSNGDKDLLYPYNNILKGQIHLITYAIKQFDSERLFQF